MIMYICNCDDPAMRDTFPVDTSDIDLGWDKAKKFAAKKWNVNVNDVHITGVERR